MIDYEQQIKAADRLADCVDRVLREKVTMAELTTFLLEYRAAQALASEELREALETLQKQMQPILDYEKKKVYKDKVESVNNDSRKPKE